MLFAAGNNGPQSFTISTPGSAKNAVAVGALSEGGTQLQWAAASSYPPPVQSYSAISFGGATFGPSFATLGAFEGRVRLAQPLEGCSTLTSYTQPSPLVILVRRGTCTFTTKAENAINAGARLVLVYDSNSFGSGTITMGTAPDYADSLTAPSLFLSGQTGATLAAQLQQGRIVSVRLGSARHTIATFSSRGPAFDGRIKPDLIAPGPFSTG